MKPQCYTGHKNYERATRNLSSRGVPEIYAQTILIFAWRRSCRDGVGISTVYLRELRVEESCTVSYAFSEWSCCRFTLSLEIEL